MLKFLFGLLLIFIIGASSILGLGAFIFYFYGKDLPDHKQLQGYIPPQTTYIMSSDARLITSYAREKRIYLTMDQIPPLVTSAFLAAEDKSFYENNGIDPLGMLRALVITSKGKHIAGGSTITQQLVKNFFLTNEKTIKRKIKEIILAFRITRTFDKDQILTLYLNKIYLGNRSYGIAAASIGYFGKSVADLNISEAAMLAALPKSPSKLDPWRNNDHVALLQRRNWVIGRMLEEGYINKYEAMASKARSMDLAAPNDRYIDNANYFGDEVRNEIVGLFGQDCLYECGMLVHTTLNPDYQSMAYAALRDGLIKFDKKRGYRGAIKNIKIAMEQFDTIADEIEAEHTMDDMRVAVVTAIYGSGVDSEAELLMKRGKVGKILFSHLGWNTFLTDKRHAFRPRNMSEALKVGDVILVSSEEDGRGYALQQIPEVNGAIVVLDTKTSRVLAMVGGYDYKQNKFNRAIQAQRQPGSVFKPFVYLTALETGQVTPATRMIDEAVVVDQGPGLPKWTPRNFKNRFLGQVLMRRGLESSINSITVKLIMLAGLDSVIETARKFSIYSGTDRHFSIALGSETVNLLSMTNAYAMIANGGRKAKTTFIEFIQNSSGKIIYRRDERACPECIIGEEDASRGMTITHHLPPEPSDTRELIADPIACFQVLSMLEGVVQRGTGRATRIDGKNIAGKTGTTNSSKDTWFIGITREITVGVYVGYDAPRDMGSHSTGASTALPIFKKFIESVDIQAGPFSVPVGVNLVKIDRHSGVMTHSNIKTDYIMEAFRIGTEPGQIAAKKGDDFDD